jgi:hypothetical protein
MRYLIFTITLLFVCELALAQRKPRDFPEKTTAADNDAIYTQEHGADGKIKFATAKRYFAPNYVTTPIGYVPTPTGNASNRTEMVKDSLGNVWYIDGAGDAVQLFTPMMGTGIDTSIIIGNSVYIVTMAGDTIFTGIADYAEKRLIQYLDGEECCLDFPLPAANTKPNWDYLFIRVDANVGEVSISPPVWIDGASKKIIHGQWTWMRAHSNGVYWTWSY